MTASTSRKPQPRAKTPLRPNPHPVAPSPLNGERAGVRGVTNPRRSFTLRAPCVLDEAEHRTSNTELPTLNLRAAPCPSHCAPRPSFDFSPRPSPGSRRRDPPDGPSHRTPLNPVGTRSTASPSWRRNSGTQWNASLPSRRGGSWAGSAGRPLQGIPRHALRGFITGQPGCTRRAGRAWARPACLVLSYEACCLRRSSQSTATSPSGPTGLVPTFRSQLCRPCG